MSQEMSMEVRPVKFKGEIIPGYVMERNTMITSVRDGDISSVGQNRNGQAIVRLYYNRYFVNFRLDALVLSTWKVYPEDTLRVTHLDGDKMNCRPENLEPISKSYITEKYKKKYNVESLDDIPEIWKVYPDIPSIEVSNLGNLRDVQTKEPVPTYDNFGYRWIFRNNTHYFVHHLVANLFIENPNPKLFKYINHLDGVKDHNMEYNLEWCDISMNTEHSFVLGNIGKYSEKTIRRVCEMLQDGIAPVVIEDETGINRKYISEIYQGRKHRSISAEYVFHKRVPLEELYNRDAILALLNSGYKPKEIAAILKLEYNQSFISYYERIKREERLKNQQDTAST